MAIAALVCGILGLVGSFIPVVQYFTFLLSLAAVITGALGRKGESKGMATAGLVLGILGIATGVIGVLCTVCVAGAFASALS